MRIAEITLVFWYHKLLKYSEALAKGFGQRFIASK